MFILIEPIKYPTYLFIYLPVTNIRYSGTSTYEIIWFWKLFHNLKFRI